MVSTALQPTSRWRPAVGYLNSRGPLGPNLVLVVEHPGVSDAPLAHSIGEIFADAAVASLLTPTNITTPAERQATPTRARLAHSVRG